MKRALLLVVLPLVLGSTPAAGADPPLLVGTVGPGFTIDLADANGKHVDVLTAGAYALLVHDRSDIHNFALGSRTTNTRNFHLVGPGVNRKTGKRFTGKATWVVKLTAGLYRFGSDPRLAGRLTVS